MSERSVVNWHIFTPGFMGCRYRALARGAAGDLSVDRDGLVLPEAVPCFPVQDTTATFPGTPTWARQGSSSLPTGWPGASLGGTASLVASKSGFGFRAQGFLECRTQVLLPSESPKPPPVHLAHGCAIGVWYLNGMVFPFELLSAVAYSQLLCHLCLQGALGHFLEVLCKPSISTA